MLTRGKRELERNRAVPKLSDKYIAGFLDADGCIELLWRPIDRADSDPSIRRLYLTLSFSQETAQDLILSRIAEATGSSFEIQVRKGRSYTRTRLNGASAVMLLERIRKHLVVKRRYADACLDVHYRGVIDKENAARYLREERRARAIPLPKHPSRSWAAGYLDGDGSFQARLPRGRSSAQPALEVACAEYDTEGIEILQKAFGGSISAERKRPDLRRWVLTIPPSKMRQLWEFCGSRMIVKRDQAELLYRCAAQMKHYRDGERIKAAMAHLKAHPHRLNEPAPDLSGLIGGIRDLEKRQSANSQELEEH